MQLKIFKEMINRTLFCATNQIIYPLHAKWEGGEVLLEKSEGKLVMAASNNRGLGFISKDAGDEIPDFEKIIVSAAILRKIRRKRGTDSLSITVSGKEAHFHIGTASFSTHLIPGEYVRFYREPEEISRNFPLSFTANRLSLLESLGMALVATASSLSSVFFDLSPGVLNMKTGDEDCSAEVELPCDYTGEKIELAFNARFLTDIIEHIDTEQVTIRFHGRQLTVMIVPEPAQDYHYFLAQRIKKG